jgi:hypothetical protein
MDNIFPFRVKQTLQPGLKGRCQSQSVAVCPFATGYEALTTTDYAEEW